MQLYITEVLNLFVIQTQSVVVVLDNCSLIYLLTAP